MTRTLRKILAMCSIARTMESLSASAIRRTGCVISTADFTNIAVGYNGPHTGAKDAEKEFEKALGTSGELHAEVNALMRKPDGHATFMIITCPPCVTCAGYILNAGIKHVVIANTKDETNNSVPIDGIARLEDHGVAVVYEMELRQSPLEIMFVAAVAGLVTAASFRAKLEGMRDATRKENEKQ